MNYWIVKVAVAFVAGAGIGVISSAIYCKKKYEKIAEDEIAQMQAYYKKIYEDFEMPEEEEVQETVEATEVAQTENKQIFTEYDRITSDILAEKEHPEDDENERKSSKAKPKLVKATECHLQKMVTLYYYTKDDVLTMASDSEGGYQAESPLDDEEIEEMAGECLDKYNFKTNDEDIIHVYSPARDEYYQIIKVRYAYEDPDREE